MEKINEDNYLSLVIDNLTLLQEMIEDKEISSMIMVLGEDQKDKIEELQSLIDYLNKTN